MVVGTQRVILPVCFSPHPIYTISCSQHIPVTRVTCYIHTQSVHSAPDSTRASPHPSSGVPPSSDNTLSSDQNQDCDPYAGFSDFGTDGRTTFLGEQGDCDPSGFNIPSNNISSLVGFTSPYVSMSLSATDNGPGDAYHCSLLASSNGPPDQENSPHSHTDRKPPTLDLESFRSNSSHWDLQPYASTAHSDLFTPTAAINLNSARQRFLSPLGRSSSGSRERGIGGLVQQNALGSARASPYPSPYTFLSPSYWESRRREARLKRRE